MVEFTDDDILRLDERFAQENLPFHVRPLRAAAEILGNQFSIEVRNPQVREIELAYERLIPEVNFTWPGMGTGLVASVDRVRKVTIGVAYGPANLTVDKGLGFSNHQEWKTWCRGDRRIAEKSLFAFADMHDLVYGIDRWQRHTVSSTSWGLAAEHLKMAAESLSQTGSIGSAILQSICLTAE